VSRTRLTKRGAEKGSLVEIRSLGHRLAVRAIDAMVASLGYEEKAAVVAVADQQGELIAFARLDGAPYPSIQIATNKAWTAARERRPSMQIGRDSRRSEAGFVTINYGDLRYTGFGGGLPVVVEHAVVGAVAVSGLSAEEAIRICEIGVDAILNELAERTIA
jgi:glc operon protein GlcG